MFLKVTKNSFYRLCIFWHQNCYWISTLADWNVDLILCKPLFSNSFFKKEQIIYFSRNILLQGHQNLSRPMQFSDRCLKSFVVFDYLFKCFNTWAYLSDNFFSNLMKSNRRRGHSTSTWTEFCYLLTPPPRGLFLYPDIFDPSASPLILSM